LDDNEDLIEDYYNKMIPYLQTYLSTIEDFKYLSYIGIYISLYNEEKINPNNLFEYRENCLNNIKKMRLDLLLPISIAKK
jgi:hypothetical protein